MMNTESNIPNCRNCKFFYITWDAHMPNGCKLYGIKSKQLPTVIVKESSGTDCLGFESKPPKKASNPYGD